MKRILAIILSVFLLCFVPVSADVIWQNEKVNTVTSGITHKYIEKFTDNGWEKINILEIDLSDSGLSLTTLYDKNGIKNLSTVSKMAKEEGVAAAVNADFFNFSPSSPLGFTVKDGEIISSPSHDTGLAALMQNEDGNVFMDYFNMLLFAVAPDGDRTQIIHINKYHSLQSVVMFTKGWGEYSPGSQNGAVELVAEDGIVTEIRENMPGAKIPENGFVLATSPEVNTFFKDNFVAGDKIEIEMTITPDYGTAQTAVGGGSILVSQGKIFSFTNNITGNNPRTAAGINKKGDILYLVTVDGRQTATPGMTQTQLAQLMIDIGSYNAINFDGGGSTTMVAQNRSGEINVLNTPSGGSERSVSTAIGVLAEHPKGDFAGFDLSLSREKVFVGDEVEITAIPYDEYFNKCSINETKIKFSSSSDGNFKDGKYYPKEAGEHIITISYDNIKEKVALLALENAASITPSQREITLQKGESCLLSVSAKDKQGFEAIVSGDMVNWSVKSGKAEVKNGVITSVDGKTAVVSAEYDNAKTFILINFENIVPGESYDFTGNDSFAGYPESVLGEAENGVLHYDFTGDTEDAKQAAYLVLEKSVSLDNIAKVELSVSSGTEAGHWLRGQIEMPDGTVERITFASEVNWTGAKKLHANITETQQKGKLTRLYLVQNDTEIKDSGYITFLNMLLYNKVSALEKYPDITKEDSFSGQVNNATFAVLPALIKEETMMDIQLNTQIKKRADENNSTYNFGNPLNNTNSTQNFSVSEKGDSLYITVNNSKGGIRAADSSQWHKLNAVDTDARNIFVILRDDLASFTDKKEKQLFCDMLTEKFYENGKNIFVIYPSEADSVTMSNGVRYISVPAAPILRATDLKNGIKDAKYLCFEVSKDEVLYQFKSLVEWEL